MSPIFEPKISHNQVEMMNEVEMLLKDLILALRHIGFNWRDVMGDYCDYQLEKKEMLLKDLVLALKHIGLNWRDIMDDYHDYQFEKSNMSSHDWFDIKFKISNFEKVVIKYS